MVKMVLVQPEAATVEQIQAVAVVVDNTVVMADLG
jgi:hypothetical protein